MIPGSNILNKALGIISSQTIAYHKFLGRTEQANGVDVSTYAPAATLRGSFQPVPRNLYQTLGLDLNKSYFNFYVSAQILDVQRGVSGDQISFSGKKYQAESTTPWNAIDGWNAVLCVQISDEDFCKC